MSSVKISLASAGFEIEISHEYEKSDADLIVLCSSDPEYLALAEEVCPKVKQPVVVAGDPKAQLEQLKGWEFRDSFTSAPTLSPL